MPDTVIQTVLSFMAKSPETSRMTAQVIADLALHDPYRAGELRDIVMPQLVAVGDVVMFPADADHNAIEYALTRRAYVTLTRWGIGD